MNPKKPTELSITITIRRKNESGNWRKDRESMYPFTSGKGEEAAAIAEEASRKIARLWSEDGVGS